jgi:hypothetical protein
MNKKIWLSAVFILFGLLPLTSCAASYTNPPQLIRGTDLEGVWEAHYGKGIIDKIVIKADGKFKQTYEDDQANYKFESPWKSWWLESFSDGRVYIHLDGGRFYPEGISIAELQGMGFPCPDQIPPDCSQFARGFWDPYTGKAVEMPGELILTLRVDSSGKLILHHMFTTPDGGFAIIGGEQEIFRTVDTEGL